IDGDLHQSGGDVQFNATSITMNSDGTINLLSNDIINIDAALNLIMNGGDSVHFQQGGEDRIVLNQEENVIYGNTTFKDGDVTIEKNLNVGGNVTVEGDIILVRDDGEDTNIMSDWLYANKGIKVGGRDYDGKTSPGNYFTVDSTGMNLKTGTLNVRDNVYATQDQFSVGGMISTKGNKINIHSSSSFLGYEYSGDFANRRGFYSAASTNFMSQRRDGYIGTDIYQVSGSTYIRSFDANNVNRAQIQTSYLGAITLTSNKANSDGSGSQTANQLTLNNYGTVLNSYDETTKATKSLAIDETGMALYDKSKALSPSSKIVKPIDDSNPESILNGAKVAIGRQGIIEVASPTGADDKGGYIKARRLLSDKRYPFSYNDAASSYGKASVPYDYYQVNPAYTSVMNDIKLATRGGARLSDILPDYINKGIYVVDNTFDNSQVSGWETKVGGKIIGIAKESMPTTEGAVQNGVIDNSIIASPWLGFVPAPQCPRDYAKVVTLTPIRWRMSEVYSVYNMDSESIGSGYSNIVTGDKFKEHFFKTTDPKQSVFELSPGSGEAHTHAVLTGRPLTFQTNTWLNTTVAEAYKANNPSIENFQGWHAVMGFIYRPTQYSQVLTDIGVTPDNTQVYWNIFPVYAGDMAGIASVYCYFNRRDDAETGWRWDTPVYKYDQLNSSTFRYGWERDNNWVESVNDPDLKYNDAW
ncbi:MAG: hypothetical protein K2M82_00085, partial [Lachnospiraceae bacterium]|nr:hypothetical protein [Lachnospiraceae bacterium]